jgi:hypothetical protein
MTTVFPGWQNTNEERSFPLHDEATRQGTTGVVLPNDVLVDAKLRVPESLGQHVYVGSVGITPALVSISFVATHDDTFGGSSSSGAADTVIAIATATRPVALYRNVSIEALQPGVGGWVTFGSGANELESFNALFDSLVDSMLVPSAATFYRDRPVESLRRDGGISRLQGDVKLAGQTAVVSIRRVVRRVDGELKEMIAIGLDASADIESLLRRFSRPCNGRPSEGTCEGQPLVAINGVPPDENGNITFSFETAGSVTPGQGGIIVDLPYGLAELCGDITLDRFDPVDLCESSSAG